MSSSEDFKKSITNGKTTNKILRVDNPIRISIVLLKSMELNWFSTSWESCPLFLLQIIYSLIKNLTALSALVMKQVKESEF